MKNVFGEVDKDCNLLTKTCKAGKDLVQRVLDDSMEV